MTYRSNTELDCPGWSASVALGGGHGSLCSYVFAGGLYAEQRTPDAPTYGRYEVLGTDGGFIMVRLYEAFHDGETLAERTHLFVLDPEEATLTRALRTLRRDADWEEQRVLQGGLAQVGALLSIGGQWDRADEPTEEDSALWCSYDFQLPGYVGRECGGGPSLDHGQMRLVSEQEGVLVVAFTPHLATATEHRIERSEDRLALTIDGVTYRRRLRPPR